MKFRKKLLRSLVKRIMPTPVKTRHYEYSMIYSVDDDLSQPSERLISLALEAVNNARTISLESISSRLKQPPLYPDIWPGEHYRLLAGLVLALKPKTVVEIGTGGGESALAMKEHLPTGSEITTFDLVPWKEMPGSSLRDEDFSDGTIKQHTDDISKPDGFAKHKKLLEQTDLFFIDAAKDNVMEYNIMDNFKTLSFTTRPILIFDDTRIWNMLKFWRSLSMPKMDMTSFGHWTGTGFVEWT